VFAITTSEFPHLPCLLGADGSTPENCFRLRSCADLRVQERRRTVRIGTKRILPLRTLASVPVLRRGTLALNTLVVPPLPCAILGRSRCPARRDRP
jgi:hypothetical protein